MSQFKPMETSTLIFCQVLLGNILGEVYELLVNVLLKLHSNSCARNIYLSNDVWVMLWIQFEALSQNFPFHSQVADMVNVVLHSHKLLAIFHLGFFSLKA